MVDSTFRGKRINGKTPRMSLYGQDVGRRLGGVFRESGYINTNVWR